MSLSLAKKSLREFEQEDSNKKQKQKKKSKVNKAKSNKKQDVEDKIQKLLLLNSSTLDDKIAQRLLKHATKAKRGARITKQQEVEDNPEKEQEGVFTEEDFENFGKELQKLHG